MRRLTPHLEPPARTPAELPVVSALRASSGYSAASVEEQSRIEALVTAFSSSATAADLESLRRVLASELWRAAGESGRAEVLEVFALLPKSDLDTGAHVQGRGVRRPTVAVAELAEAELNGSSKLLDTAHGGGTLGHHLAVAAHRFAALSPSGAVLSQTGLSPAQILGGLVLDVNDCGRISQGNVGPRLMTALQDMIGQQPAEYARLCTGLVADGTVTMRGGEALEREPSSVPPAPGSYATVTDRILQSALIERSTRGERFYRQGGGGVQPDEDLLAGAQAVSWALAIPRGVASLWPRAWHALTSDEAARLLRR